MANKEACWTAIKLGTKLTLNNMGVKWATRKLNPRLPRNLKQGPNSCKNVQTAAENPQSGTHKMGKKNTTDTQGMESEQTDHREQSQRHDQNSNEKPLKHTRTAGPTWKWSKQTKMSRRNELKRWRCELIAGRWRVDAIQDSYTKNDCKSV